MFHKLESGVRVGLLEGNDPAKAVTPTHSETSQLEASRDWRVDDEIPLPQIVVSTIHTTEVVSVNDRFTRAFGYSLPELVDFRKAVGHLFPDESDRRRLIEWWDSAFGGLAGRGHPRKCLITAKDGSGVEAVICGRRRFGVVHLFFLLAGRRHYGDPGGVPGKDGSLDQQIAGLTGRLMRQQRCLENTLNAMVDPHLLLEPVEGTGGEVVDFLVVHSNPAARRHLGESEVPLEGKTLAEITPQDQVRAFMAWGRDVLRTKEPLIMNEHAHNRDFYGKETRYDIRVVAVDGMLSWTWRDVTDRHNAARKIHESEEKYRLIAQNSSDIIVLSNEEGRMKWVSPSVAKILGWDIYEWVGRRRSDFFAGGECECGEVQNSSIQEGGTVIEREKLKAKNGTDHWVEVYSGPYLDSGGRMAGIVSTIRVIDRQVEAEEQLLRRARTDELTNLFNRKEVLDRLNQYKGESHRTGGRLGVLFVDLDRFKTINDTHGHAAGDAVLKTIAERIKDTLRTEDDIGARVGGDEMLVVLHGVHDLADTAAVGEKLRRKIEDPIEFDGKEIRATVSVGVAMAGTGEGVDELIARADNAMYQAKLHGRNQVVTIE